MTNVRDGALLGLSEGEQARVLLLGGSARLDNDDPMWVILAASVRLDPAVIAASVAKISTAHTRQVLDSVVAQTALRLKGLCNDVVLADRWRHPPQRLLIVAITAIALVCTHTAAFLLAERGWIGYRQNEINKLAGEHEELMLKAEALRRNLPPDWLVMSWAKSDGVLVLKIPSDRVHVGSCEVRHTCVRVDHQ